MHFTKINNIIEEIRRYYPVSDNSIDELSCSFTEHYLPKHHLLTKAGTKDNYVYFIEQGCTRTFFLIADKEITNWFSNCLKIN